METVSGYFMTIKTTAYGDISIIDGDADLITRFLHLYGEWGYAETLVACTLARDDEVLWDIGAHLGTFSLGMSKLAKLGRVLAIDISEQLAEHLQLNLTNNLNIPFDCIQAGVSSHIGFGSLYLRDPANRGAAQFMFSEGDTAKISSPIPATTLKALRDQFGDYGFLKLDIEGMEVEAIAGDEDYIRGCKPIIWAECNEDRRSYALLDRLLSLGYIPRYVAFPSIRSDNFRGNHEMVYPMAYEAALVGASPDRLNRLSVDAVTDPCIVRTINNHDDLRQALWDTPRWARQEWVDLSKPELIARIGRMVRGECARITRACRSSILDNPRTMRVPLRLMRCC
jgi:FkbM family methyltransferase